MDEKRIEMLRTINTLYDLLERASRERDAEIQAVLRRAIYYLEMRMVEEDVKRIEQLIDNN